MTPRPSVCAKLEGSNNLWRIGALYSNERSPLDAATAVT